MEEEHNIQRLNNRLRRSGMWMGVIVLAGLGFTGLMLLKFTAWFNWASGKDRFAAIIIWALVGISLFRYFLFMRKQQGLSKRDNRNEQEKIGRFYKRSLYFWITDAVVTISALLLFLYLLWYNF